MKTITIDISKPGPVETLCVREGDAMSRFFAITIWDNGTEYKPPTGAAYSIRYEVGINTGWYDTINLVNGTTRSAVTVSGNTLTCEIAEAATHGEGKLCVLVETSTGYRLALPDIRIRGDYVPAESAGETNDYYNTHIQEMLERCILGSINAAPAGYGLGTSAKNITGTDLLDVLQRGESGWYRGNNVTNAPVATWCYFEVICSSTSYAVVNCWTYSGYACRAYYVDGVFQPWEWINPPMLPGIEYRTTERWYGHVVYAKLIDCGAASNGKTIDLTGMHVIMDFGRVGNTPIPYGYAGASGYMYRNITLEQLTLYCTSNFTANWYHQVWYWYDD